MRPGCGTLYGNTAVQKCYGAEVSHTVRPVKIPAGIRHPVHQRDHPALFMRAWTGTTDGSPNSTIYLCGKRMVVRRQLTVREVTSLSSG
jgi:hypothetical protein